jgi:hypothetical protein
MADTVVPPNPKRVEAGRRNRLLRGTLTAAGREKLRQTILQNRPWERSTGPRSSAGKAAAAANGKARQRGLTSIREAYAIVREILGPINANRGAIESLLAGLHEGRKS